MATPTGGLNKKGNRRGMTPAQREALARGREGRRCQRGGKTCHLSTGLTGRESIAVSGRLRRFVEAYDNDPALLGKVAVGQLLADLWDANLFLRPVWVTVRRLAKRLNSANRNGKGQGGNGANLEADLEILAALDGLVPVMDQLGRWFKRTTDTALRLGEMSVRLRTGGSDDYLKRRYGSGGENAPKGPGEGEVPPDAEDAVVLEDDGAGPGESPHGATSPAEPEPPQDGA